MFELKKNDTYHIQINNFEDVPKLEDEAILFEIINKDYSSIEDLNNLTNINSSI